jgi:methylase of polypeptide subunit release factors
MKGDPGKDLSRQAFAKTSKTAMSALASATLPGKEINVHGLRLFVDMGVGIGGDKWPACDMFCDFIEDVRWTAFFSEIFRGKRVIEIGSGNGLAGILVDRLFDPAEVVITDMDSHVHHIQHNIDINPSHKPSRSRSAVFDWLDPPTTLGKFDVILAFEW